MTIAGILSSTGPVPFGVGRVAPTGQGTPAPAVVANVPARNDTARPAISTERTGQKPDRRADQKPETSPARTSLAGLGGRSAIEAQAIASAGAERPSAQARALPKNYNAATRLSPEEQAAISRLQARDREVRAHERAHAAAGGSYAGAPQLEFETGPDGRQYAVSGSVSIDTSPVAGDPAATVRKMETVRRAALAPARPSGQDRAVAQAADAKARSASAEVTAQKRDEAAALLEGDAEEGPVGATTIDGSNANSPRPSPVAPPLISGISDTNNAPQTFEPILANLIA